MRKLLLVPLAGLVVVGGLTFAATRFVAAPADDAIGLVPPNASVYVSLFVEPSRDQRSKLDSILEKIPKVDSLDKAKNELIALIDPELERVGLDYEKDVEP
ncbi:MAG: DUF3352 domain-containing protein, partial [Actinomycetota bacterium]|nr:DUF3352 domain-containing protein [Actinomycetota bacterium]